MTTALTFELDCRKEAQKSVKGAYVRDDARYEELPERPAQFTPVVGSYQVVSANAVRLNDAQLRSGFLDYLFFPEVKSPVGV